MTFPKLTAVRVTVISALFLVPSGLAPAQDADYVKANYTKYDFRVPMRDGVRLFTSVYVPKDTSRRYPILLQRTPYSVAPYGVDRYPTGLGPSPLFARSGYIFAYQDARGCFLSEGDFQDMRPHRAVKNGPGDTDESTDTYDTIEWLLGHVEGHNGKVGQWGISYVGFYAACGLLDAHPAMKAVSPQAPQIDWFLGDDVHHNGAFFLHQEFSFDSVFGRPRPKPTTRWGSPLDLGTPDAYAFFLALGPVSRADELYFKGQRAFWNDVMKHGTYDDFWKARSLLPHFKDVKPAALTVGGWFDAEDLFGPLQSFQAMERAGPRTENTLVMGPWVHGGWARGDGDSVGPVRFNDKTARFFREKIEFPFFEYHLKGQGEWSPPKAFVFETGRNHWHRQACWPPREAGRKSLFMYAGGRLSWEPPADAIEAFDEYISDPARPVPYTSTISIVYPRTFMTEDQRFAARRPDVLTYQSEVLAEDLTVAGPIQAELHVSTSGTDADWVIKVIDVYPNDHSNPDPNPAGVKMGGYQQLVRSEVMRGKFRDSFEKPVPFAPNKPAVVRFTLPDVYHTFRPGHRIMVQVQSSWFPLVDRNPQTFLDIYSAKASDFRKATQRVYRCSGRPSHLELLVLP
jgi:putative CocE/NonD family hydrolase